MLSFKTQSKIDFLPSIFGCRKVLGQKAECGHKNLSNCPSLSFKADIFSVRVTKTTVRERISLVNISNYLSDSTKHLTQ